MRTVIFANRVTKEIIRDPLSLFFGIVFPVILLLLLSAINSSIPVDLFNLTSLAPGIAVFGLSFMALFAAQIVSKDRESSFLSRLFTTPMTAQNFILGYILPLIAMAIVQTIICMLVAMLLGLSFTFNIFSLIIILVPVSLLYISLGLISGTLFSEKAAVGICGALLTNLSAWLSGIWFDLDLVGGMFKEIAHALPFFHAVEMSKAALMGEFNHILPHLWWVLGYVIILVILAIVLFRRKTQEK